MPSILGDIETMADVLDQLGVAPERVLMRPVPGTATEQDVIAAYARNKSLCELVDRVLVEKAPGHYESRLATVLGYYLESFLGNRNEGFTVGGNAFFRLGPGLVRSPCLSYTRWGRLPNRRIPRDAIVDVIPNLVVEVLRSNNSAPEMARKRREYFDARVERVWQIDPEERTCEVFMSPDDSFAIGIDGIVEGGTVLPGFQLSLREYFARADTGGLPTTP